MNDNQEIITGEELNKRLPALMKEFDKEHGKDTLKRIYFDQLNENTLTHLPYHRDASLFLIAYFMSAALNKPEHQLNTLLYNFTKVASQKGRGNDGGFNTEILNKIVNATKNIIENEITNADKTHSGLTPTAA